MFLILLGDPGSSDFFLPGFPGEIPGTPGILLLPLPDPFLGPKMAARSLTLTSSSVAAPLLEEEVALRPLEAAVAGAGKLLGRLA